MCIFSGFVCISVVVINGSIRFFGGVRVSVGGISFVVCISFVISIVVRLVGGSSGIIVVGNIVRGSGSVISIGGRVVVSEFVFSFFSFVGGVFSGISISVRCSISVMFLIGIFYIVNRVFFVIIFLISKGVLVVGIIGVVFEEILIVVVSVFVEMVGVGGEVFVRSGKLVGVSGGWENKVIWVILIYNICSIVRLLFIGVFSIVVRGSFRRGIVIVVSFVCIVVG